ncbi:MAG: DUF6077 domain-containing protein [Magnetococcus sp. YQC-5]
MARDFFPGHPSWPTDIKNIRETKSFLDPCIHQPTGEHLLLRPFNSLTTTLTMTESILAIVLIGMALWTLLAHAVGFLWHGPFVHLSFASWLIPVVGYYVYRLIARPVSPPDPVSCSDSSLQSCDWQQFGIAVALVAMYEFSDVYFPASRLYLFWGMAMLFLGRAWFLTRKRESIPPLPLIMTRSDAILFGLTVAGVVCVTLFAHRPDPDDQYYSNLAVMTLDHPDRPLLSWNNMIWSQKTITWMPVDRLPSYELLVALVASWFHVEPIAISHLFFSPVFAALTVLAQSLLLRYWMPGHWLAVLLVEIFLLLALGGETRAGYGIFAFVQLHFGKSFLFSAILPLLVLFGLRFMHTGSRRDWLLLVVTQIAGLGCSSSALFLAPVAAGLGLAANWRMDWTTTKRLLVGVTSSFYLLFMGLSMMMAMTQAMDSISWVPFTIDNNFSKVFGSGTHLWLYMLAMIGAWTLMTDPALRRTLLGLSFVFVGIFFNPFLYPLFSQYLTGTLTTWRLYFTIPMPAMASLLLLSLVAAWNRDRRPVAPFFIFISVVLLLILSTFSQWRMFWSQPFSLAVSALLILFFTLLTSRFRSAITLLTLIALLACLSHFSTQQMTKRTTIASPRTQLHWPSIKADQPAFTVARHTVQWAPAGKSALVPMDIATWIPTLRHNPLLVATSIGYLEQVQSWLEPRSIERRLALLDYISGVKRLDDATGQLSEAIDFYKIGIIVVHHANPWISEIEAIVSTLGFQKSAQDGYLYWVRPS